MLKIANLLPEYFGTYGDGGNALVLGERARRRGLDVEVVDVHVGTALPGADLYLLGGGEDGPQRQGALELRGSSLAARVADGAWLFAVCAGLQVLGRTFAVEGDDEFEGLGVVDAVTRRGASRSVGDLAVRVEDSIEGVVVGFENHGGVTTLGPGVAPFGSVLLGRGNDGIVDGVRAERVWGTYAHGPVLAQNPWLADTLLAAVLGRTLEPLATPSDRLHAVRMNSLGLTSGAPTVRSGRRSGRR